MIPTYDDSKKRSLDSINEFELELSKKMIMMLTNLSLIDLQLLI